MLNRPSHHAAHEPRMSREPAVRSAGGLRGCLTRWILPARMAGALLARFVPGLPACEVMSVVHVALWPPHTRDAAESVVAVTDPHRKQA